MFDGTGGVMNTSMSGGEVVQQWRRRRISTAGERPQVDFLADSHAFEEVESPGQLVGDRSALLGEQRGMGGESIEAASEVAAYGVVDDAEQLRVDLVRSRHGECS
ncbi:hypothetical protein [Rhodococcus sp. IEGM 1307]|uniref:hypothetical protein n=1 Tax=Rhodococcus sp. IEGM 1307 TaxID=3047091 RepID=UPI0024B7E15F|nr:hypothetical protein [Rhodococcus sp. IEGM 1307]MDI9980038.1 hypothetical protein [Rhodococcus sp. IEGM 1307]